MAQNLKNVRWLTQVQPLDPGSQKVAHQLQAAGLLTEYDGLDLPFRSGVLLHCQGSDLNNADLALITLIESEKLALLVGVLSDK